MTHVIETVIPRNGLARWRVAGCVAAAAVIAAGCGKARHTYPTISAVNPDGGNVNVHGTYNHCPQLIFVASPDHADVGGTIALSVSASDAENDPLTYAWSATAGTIDKPDAPMTTFHCTARGAVTISLTVGDGNCDSKTSGDVLCRSDDAGAPDGGAAGAGGGAGTGGQAGAGGQAGTTGAGGTGGSSTAGSAGRGGSTGTGVGGSTATGTGGSTGVAGTGGGGPCIESNPPPDIATACSACIAAMSNPMTDGCCALPDATGRQLCQAAAACMRAGMCVMDGDATACFCGTNGGTCDQPGQSNGPCVNEMKAAAGRNVATMTTDTPTTPQVVARQGDPNFALGRASNIINVAGLYCPTECGF